MNCDRWLKAGTKVVVRSVEPDDLPKGAFVGAKGKVVEAPNMFKGMVYNDKKHKLAWCPLVELENGCRLFLGHHQIELAAR